MRLQLLASSILSGSSTAEFWRGGFSIFLACLPRPCRRCFGKRLHVGILVLPSRVHHANHSRLSFGSSQPIANIFRLAVIVSGDYLPVPAVCKKLQTLGSLLKVPRQDDDFLFEPFPRPAE